MRKSRGKTKIAGKVDKVIKTAKTAASIGNCAVGTVNTAAKIGGLATTAGLVGHVALPIKKKKNADSPTDNSWERVAKRLGDES
jgi:hypothetical protein